jgi:hypothetical protein
MVHVVDASVDPPLSRNTDPALVAEGGMFPAETQAVFVPEV